MTQRTASHVASRPFRSSTNVIGGPGTTVMSNEKSTGDDVAVTRFHGVPAGQTFTRLPANTRHQAAVVGPRTRHARPRVDNVRVDMHLTGRRCDPRARRSLA